MVRVGVIDSGPGPDDHAAARAVMADGSVMPAHPDMLGHGTAVAAIIRRACPGAAIAHAQVFGDRPVTNALRVAAALRWFATMGEARPDVICMSLGLAADRAPLGKACKALVADGLVLVAAHPARGASCFPAAYPGVIAATGDARCGWDDLSHLGPALFGAWCNSPERGPAGMGGASMGAARVAGHLAAIVARTGRLDGPGAIAALAAHAVHHGPERKSRHG